VFVPITSLGPIFGGQLGARQSVGYDNFWGSLLVRRKPGVSLSEATRDASEAFRRSWEAQRQAQPNADRAPVEEAQPRVVVGSVRPGGGPAPALEVQTALWVTGVAGIVLLIACANLCNLMLSRAVARQQEIATLTALGASRGRLMTRAVAETLLLAALGAAGAVAIAQWSVASILAILIPNAVDLVPVTSPRTLAATGTAALTIGIILGLLPMVLLARPATGSPMRSATRGETTRTSRLRSALVVAQAALSLVLLVGAVLFTRSLNAVRAMPYGYDAGQILLVNTTLRGPALPPPDRAALQQRLLDTARSLPGVEAAAWKVSTPLGLNASMRFFADGIATVADRGQFTAQSGSEDYFTAMGTRILRGRGFTAADRPGVPPVVVVSAGMADALWPGQDPIGKCLRFGSTSAPCTSVVGVAEDIVQTSITSAERYQYYLPLGAAAPATGMVLRFRGAAQHHGEMARQALQPLMPGLSYVTVQPLEELVTRAQRSWRLGATMFMVLGGLAVAVAAIGLYGVIRYSVAQRRREMSVRAALGARSSDLVRLIVGPSLRLTGLGIVAGAGIAVAARSKVQPLLFQQSATDPTAFLVAAAVLGLAAFAASLVPALRAARVPPGEALRAE
jgi:putative ABC transport system permease protein